MVNVHEVSKYDTKDKVENGSMINGAVKGGVYGIEEVCHSTKKK